MPIRSIGIDVLATGSARRPLVRGRPLKSAVSCGQLEVVVEGARIEELPYERRRSGLDGLAVTDEQGLEVQSRELGYRALGLFDVLGTPDG